MRLQDLSSRSGSFGKDFSDEAFASSSHIVRQDNGRRQKKKNKGINSPRII